MNGGNARPGSRIRRPSTDKKPGRDVDIDVTRPKLEPQKPKPRPRPQKPKPGSKSLTVSVGEPELRDRLRLAATRQAFGPKAKPNVQRHVVWVSGPNELSIVPGALKVRIGEGRININVPVRCEEIAKPVEVPLTFAVGSSKRAAGLTATTPAVPESMEEPLALWAESVIAFGWNVLLDSAVMIAAAEGDDSDGDPLAPLSLTASKGMLDVGIGSRSRRSKDRITDAARSDRVRGRR